MKLNFTQFFYYFSPIWLVKHGTACNYNVRTSIFNQTNVFFINTTVNFKINFLTEKLTVESELDVDTVYERTCKAAAAFSKDIVINK